MPTENPHFLTEVQKISSNTQPSADSSGVLFESSNLITQDDLSKKKESPSNNSEIDKNYSTQAMDIWNKTYKKGEHKEAKEKFEFLLAEARDQGISQEKDASISFFLAFSTYHDDRREKVENTAHTIAKEAREKTEDHRTLSNLYQVEGLSHFQNRNKGEAESLLNLSHEEAVKSGDDNTVGAALNGIGINLNNEKMYSDAIRFLQDAVEYHKNARNKGEPDSIREANVHNNLIVAYTGRGKETEGDTARLAYLTMAEEAADEALTLYNDKTLHHSFGARAKLVTAYTELGNNEEHFNKAIDLLETQMSLRNEQSQLEPSNKGKNDEFNTKDQNKIDGLRAKIQGLQQQ